MGESNHGGSHGSTDWSHIQEGYKRIQGALKDQEGLVIERTLQAEEMVQASKM